MSETIPYNGEFFMGRRALITGITGQDGSYLAEFLLAKGYEVHGAVRRVALEDPEHRLVRLSAVRDRVVLHAASLESFASVYQLVAKVAPDECYHLAAQSFVSYSFDDEFSTLNTNINGTHFLLSAVKDLAPKCRFYFAGSSEMFGKAEEIPQTERHALPPALELWHQQGLRFRADAQLSRSLWAACQQRHSVQPRVAAPRLRICHPKNHVRRGPHSSRAQASRSSWAISRRSRDWGHAREYVAAMWLMLQQPEPDDYVVATGETHSVREFVELAFSHAGLDYRDHVATDPTLFRPAEVNLLLGDAPRRGPNWGGRQVSLSSLWCAKWSIRIAARSEWRGSARPVVAAAS